MLDHVLDYKIRTFPTIAASNGPIGSGYLNGFAAGLVLRSVFLLAWFGGGSRV